MTREELDPICWQSGITTWYADREVPDETKRALLAALGIDPAAPDTSAIPDFQADPASAGACALPDWLVERPTWGLFCQLYELRSATSWGIGDYGDLRRLAGIAGRAGADFLGVNPVHALFLAEPDRRSPFMPSNRRFLNPLYLAMDDLPGPAEADADAIAAVEAGDLVDYPAVTALKLAALTRVFAATPFNTERWSEARFDAFCAAEGPALYRHALFEALAEEMAASGHTARWPYWPEGFRDPQSAEVAGFAEAHATRIRFHQWLQWLAEGQLAEARDAALAAGMRIGLYLDLAVGEAPDGSAAWGTPGLTLRGIEVGAPPDVFAQEGQNWALAALSPVALAEMDYEPFRALIATQLDLAGALRIDHVMALRQLFLVPEGLRPLAGTHMAYPLADMLRVVAEESRKHNAVMIGEDLGWVPDGFREVLAAANLLSMRILYFEQEYGLFPRAHTWPEMALACASTHDLPTLAAWWRGDDIVLRQAHGLITPDKAAGDTATRDQERHAIVGALIDGGQLPEGAPDAAEPEMPARMVEAVYRFLASTPSRLLGVRLADLVGPELATNVPGTLDQYPNWRVRAPLKVEDIEAVETFRTVTAAMREMRTRG